MRAMLMRYYVTRQQRWQGIRVAPARVSGEERGARRRRVVMRSRAQAGGTRCAQPRGCRQKGGRQREARVAGAAQQCAGSSVVENGAGAGVQQTCSAVTSAYGMRKARYVVMLCRLLSLSRLIIFISSFIAWYWHFPFSHNIFDLYFFFFLAAYLYFHFRFLLSYLLRLFFALIFWYYATSCFDDIAATPFFLFFFFFSFTLFAWFIFMLPFATFDYLFISCLSPFRYFIYAALLLIFVSIVFLFFFCSFILFFMPLDELIFFVDIFVFLRSCLPYFASWCSITPLIFISFSQAALLAADFFISYLRRHRYFFSLLRFLFISFIIFFDVFYWLCHFRWLRHADDFHFRFISPWWCCHFDSFISSLRHFIFAMPLLIDLFHFIIFITAVLFIISFLRLLHYFWCFIISFYIYFSSLIYFIFYVRASFCWWFIIFYCRFFSSSCCLIFAIYFAAIFFSCHWCWHFRWCFLYAIIDYVSLIYFLSMMMLSFSSLYYFHFHFHWCFSPFYFDFQMPIFFHFLFSPIRFHAYLMFLLDALLFAAITLLSFAMSLLSFCHILILFDAIFAIIFLLIFRLCAMPLPLLRRRFSRSFFLFFFTPPHRRRFFAFARYLPCSLLLYAFYHAIIFFFFRRRRFIAADFSLRAIGLFYFDIISDIILPLHYYIIFDALADRLFAGFRILFADAAIAIDDYIFIYILCHYWYIIFISLFIDIYFRRLFSLIIIFIFSFIFFLSIIFAIFDVAADIIYLSLIFADIAFFRFHFAIFFLSMLSSPHFFHIISLFHFSIFFHLRFLHATLFSSFIIDDGFFIIDYWFDVSFHFSFSLSDAAFIFCRCCFRHFWCIRWWFIDALFRRLMPFIIFFIFITPMIIFMLLIIFFLRFIYMILIIFFAIDYFDAMLLIDDDAFFFFFFFLLPLLFRHDDDAAYFSPPLFSDCWYLHAAFIYFHYLLRWSTLIIIFIFIPSPSAMMLPDISFAPLMMPMSDAAWFRCRFSRWCAAGLISPRWFRRFRFFFIYISRWYFLLLAALFSLLPLISRHILIRAHIKFSRTRYLRYYARGVQAACRNRAVRAQRCGHTIRYGVRDASACAFIKGCLLIDGHCHFDDISFAFWYFMPFHIIILFRRLISLPFSFHFHWCRIFYFHWLFIFIFLYFWLRFSFIYRLLFPILFYFAIWLSFSLIFISAVFFWCLCFRFILLFHWHCYIFMLFTLSFMMLILPLIFIDIFAIDFHFRFHIFLSLHLFSSLRQLRRFLRHFRRYIFIAFDDRRRFLSFCYYWYYVSPFISWCFTLVIRLLY